MAARSGQENDQSRILYWNQGHILGLLNLENGVFFLYYESVSDEKRFTEIRVMMMVMTMMMLL